MPLAMPQTQGTQQPTSSRRFEATGRLLRARVVLTGQQQAVLSNLLLDENACFRETQTAQPNERPLVIRGNRLEVKDAATPNATVSVTGQPARFEGRGLGLTGTNINLNLGANRLWIEGPGQMDAPLSEGMGVPGQPVAMPGVLTIDWRRGMEFDGRMAKFEENVVAMAPQRLLQTETMRVQMLRPIVFSESASQPQPQIEEIQCCGGVVMEQRAFDPQQQPISFDRMQLSDLAINVLSGEMKGGPGWVNTVRFGSASVLTDPAIAPGGPSGATTAAMLAAPTPQLICLNVRFQKSLTGNVLRRQMAFSDQVKMAYAPVNDWSATLNTDNPDKLGPAGVVVRCDRLSVVQMVLPIGNRSSVELEALGNAVVENTQFTARGHRVTYDEAKDWLILRGDGRNPSELFEQPEPGAPRSEVKALEIHYWPKTRRVKVTGAQSLQSR